MSTMRSTRMARSLRRHQDLNNITAPYFITGPQLNRLPKNDLKLPDIQGYATTTLVDIRKKHDFQRRQSLNRQRDLGKKKDELQALKTKQNQLMQFLDKMNKSTAGLQQSLQESRLKMQQLDMQKRVLSYLITGSKDDNVVYKNRLNLLQKELKKSRFGLQNCRQNITKAHNRKKQALKLQAKLNQDLNNLRIQRDLKYKYKQGVNFQFQELKNQKIQRTAHLQQVAERVMQQKDSTQRQIQKLMLTHRFLQNMMRDKMQRQMNRFKHIEQAFKSIKLSTGVSDTSDLVNKFLTKQAAYGQLLYKITENQKKIDSLRADNNMLVAQRKRLGHDLTMYQAPSYQKVHLDLQQKQLKQSQDQAKIIQIIENKLKMWLKKTVRKIQVVIKNQKSQTLQGIQQYSNTQDGIIKTLNKIVTLAQSCKEDNKLQSNIEVLQSKEYNERNVRVKIRSQPDNEQQ